MKTARKTYHAKTKALRDLVAVKRKYGERVALALVQRAPSKRRIRAAAMKRALIRAGKKITRTERLVGTVVVPRFKTLEVDIVGTAPYVSNNAFHIFFAAGEGCCRTELSFKKSIPTSGSAAKEK